MEKITISKASALFNFLLDNFDADKKLGELNYRDIMKIINFLSEVHSNE